MGVVPDGDEARQRCHTPRLLLPPVSQAPLASPSHFLTACFTQRRCCIIEIASKNEEVQVVRCPKCGNLNRWSSIAIQPCRVCGMFMIMPSEEDARNNGVFEGVAQPYHWEVDSGEVCLIFDALDALMRDFQTALT